MLTRTSVALALVAVLAAAACGDASTDTTTTTAAPAAPTTRATTTTAAATTTTTTIAAATTTTAAVTTTTTTTGEAAPGMNPDGTIADARTIRQFILDTVIAWGEAALDPPALVGGIETVYPIAFTGYVVPADPATVSLFVGAFDDKDVIGPENPHVVVVAVMDTEGRCVGGVAYGFPAPDSVVLADPDADQCTAGAVLDMAGPQIQA